MSSAQSKINRVRKPRVHMTYDVEVGDASEKKEIPFLMGVLGDFSGQPMKRTADGEYQPVELRPLNERRFVEINRDNINDVLKKMTPGLSMEVENTLEGDGSTLQVNLAFESLKDFEPAQVAQQIPALKKLLDIREQLSELKTKADISGKLGDVLEELLKDKEKLGATAAELGIGTGDKTSSE